MSVTVQAPGHTDDRHLDRLLEGPVLSLRNVAELGLIHDAGTSDTPAFAAPGCAHGSP